MKLGNVATWKRKKSVAYVDRLSLMFYNCNKNVHYRKKC